MILDRVMNGTDVTNTMEHVAVVLRVVTIVEEEEGADGLEVEVVTAKQTNQNGCLPQSIRYSLLK